MSEVDAPAHRDGNGMPQGPDIMPPWFFGHGTKLVSSLCHRLVPSRLWYHAQLPMALTPVAMFAQSGDMTVDVFPVERGRQAVEGEVRRQAGSSRPNQ